LLARNNAWEKTAEHDPVWGRFVELFRFAGLAGEGAAMAPAAMIRRIGVGTAEHQPDAPARRSAEVLRSGAVSAPRGGVIVDNGPSQIRAAAELRYSAMASAGLPCGVESSHSPIRRQILATRDCR
jgi:hypothetical protein